MRYLYGDSAPFPLQYNFLQTLEVFVASATKAVELEAEARAIQAQATDLSATRLRNIDGLERFHQVVMRSLHESSSRAMEGLMVDYARQLAEQAQRIVEVSRTQAAQANEREIATARAEVERRRADIRTACEAFFKVGRLPLTEVRVSATLPTSRPTYDMSAVLTFAEGIVVGYTIGADAVPEWRHPRRAAEFAQGISLMVGAKKSWFKKTVQPELVNLDDFYLSGFDLSDDNAVIRLRRRPDQEDSLVFTVRRVDANLFAEVAHPDDPEADGQLPTAVDAGDRVHLERLWQLLRQAAMPALEHKTRVVSLYVDGEDVFASEKVGALIERIVRLVAPTVAEIARRSPNAQELSLKIEHEGGRREEVYLMKADLTAKITSLGANEQTIFSPLPLGQGEPTVILPGT
jgi:hypothetical protein